MSHEKQSRTFLTEREAQDHQRGIKNWSSPYSESYGLGVSQCTVQLEDNSIVSAWKSEYEVYSG